MPAFLVSIMRNLFHLPLLPQGAAVEQDPRQPIDSHDSDELDADQRHRQALDDARRDQARINEQIEQINETAEKASPRPASLGDTKILSRAFASCPTRSKSLPPIARGARSSSLAPPAPRRKAFVQTGVELGRAMADAGWMVVTGAGNGIMEAGHVGAGRENSMGLNIMLPFEQSSNSVIAGDPKLVTMKYFFTRKLMFVKECDAMVLLPGGFGTLDEGLEVHTLLQTGKRAWCR